MAHGAGGKATQSMIEGLFVPAFGGETLEAMGDAGAVSVDGAELAHDDRLVRGQADPLPRRLDRRPRRERHGERPRGLRRAPARAEPVADPRGGPGRGRPARRGRGDRRGGRGGRGRDRRAATPRSSSAAPRIRCTSARPGSAGATRARALATDAIRPGDRILLSGTIGEHGTAIMLARGEFELDAAIESDTRSLWPVVDALLEEAGPRCAACATPRAAAWPRC